MWRPKIPSTSKNFKSFRSFKCLACLLLSATCLLQNGWFSLLLECSGGWCYTSMEHPIHTYTYIYVLGRQNRGSSDWRPSQCVWKYIRNIGKTKRFVQGNLSIKPQPPGLYFISYKNTLLISWLAYFCHHVASQNTLNIKKISKSFNFLACLRLYP
jgi:hypothetical protein